MPNRESYDEMMEEASRMAETILNDLKAAGVEVEEGPTRYAAELAQTYGLDEEAFLHIVRTMFNLAT